MDGAKQNTELSELSKMVDRHGEETRRIVKKREEDESKSLEILENVIAELESNIMLIEDLRKLVIRVKKQALEMKIADVKIGQLRGENERLKRLL